MMGFSIPFGVFVLILVIWLLFRKGGYKRVPLDAPPGPDWVLTEERFVDPSSGESLEVWFHPSSGERAYVPLVAGRAVKLMVPRNAHERPIARVVYSGPVRAPVHKGQKIGMLKVWRGKEVVLEVPLQAGEDVGTGAIHRRAFDAATELFIGLFRAGFQRL